MKSKVDYAQAILIATELAKLLRPACARIEIAGSLRRERAQVGDIELVAIPRCAVNLFGNAGQELLTPAVARIAVGGYSKDGDKFKQFRYRDMQVDLFITTAPRWGINYTLRTGSAEFSHWLVTARRYGGAMPAHLRVKHLRLWQGTKTLDTSTEALFFAALGLRWIAPQDRDAGRVDWNAYLRPETKL